MRVPLLLVAALTTPTALLAQMDHGPAGHHDEGRLGRVRFATSCSAAAQPVFERAVAYLHSFWFERAGETFREAAAADSTCAMAYWGLSSSYLHPLWVAPTPAELLEGTNAAARARALAPAQGRERDWVDAIGAYWQDAATVPHGRRLAAWSAALGRIHATYPDDQEAAIFYALSLIAVASKTDTSYAQLRQAGAILEPLFERQSDHPGVAHYLIHSYDTPALVREAVAAANRYAGIAPSVPHAQHMPSHSYTLLGLWDQSIAANRRSAEAARRFEVEQHMDGVWDQRLHAMDYMAYAYLQQGKDALARGLVDEAAGVQRTIPPTSPAALYALAAIPVRYALERGDWAAAAATVPRPAGAPHIIAVGHFARALGAARRGDTAAARADLARLAELEAAARQTPDPFAPTMVRVNRLAAEAWLLLATGDTAGALRSAAEAADTEDQALKNPLTPGPLLSARELLGEMQLQLGRPADAVTTFRTALVSTPRRARTLSNAVRAADAARDSAAARQWRGELRDLLGHADPERRAVLTASR